MREILFRGKDPNHKWVEGYVGSVFTCDKNRKPILRDFIELDCLGWNSHTYVYDETVGQYTGCRDKSKTTKVFEGDIVWDEINEQYGVVDFNDGEFVVNFNGNIDADRFADVINCCYVCGNFHDNPELLRGGGDNA